MMPTFPNVSACLGALLASVLLFMACEEDPVPNQIGGPRFLELRYDAENFNSPQLIPGTYEATVRFNDTMVSEFVGKELREIEFYIFDRPDSCQINIYEGTIAKEPVRLLYSKDITGSIQRQDWNVHQLDPPLVLEQEDLWVGIAFKHEFQQGTIGCDPGPAKTDADWLWDIIDDRWIPFSQRSPISVNWNIRARIADE